MKKNKLKIISGLILTLFIISGLRLPITKAQPEPDATLQYVFLIAVDGLNTEMYAKYPTANLRFLANEGVYDDKSYTWASDTLEAGVASLLTGTFADEHQHYSSNDSVEVQSLMDVFTKVGKTSAILDGSGGKLQSFARGERGYVSIDGKEPDSHVFAQAVEYFNTHKPFFTLIYSNDLNEALLSRDDKAYSQAIIGIDRGVGQLLDLLRQQQLIDHALFVLTSPRASSSSQQSPLLIFGTNCKKNLRISNTMLSDVAPTITELCGVEKPYAGRGLSIYEAIQYTPEQESNVNLKWLRELKAERIATWQKYFILDDKLNKTINQMMVIREEKEEIHNWAGNREQLILSIKRGHNIERVILIALIGLLLVGYGVQYRRLKKKFLLFR